MTVQVLRVARPRQAPKMNSVVDLQIWQYCVNHSERLYEGCVNGEVACVFGLIPPTVLSSQAYLWLYITPMCEDHKFLLIRHSRIFLEEALKEYPIIVGHCIIGNDRAFRWLKWLGAEFGEPDGVKIPFWITHHG